MTNTANDRPGISYLAAEITEIGDNGGRRSRIDRRRFSYDGHIPERRQQSGRRIEVDRRNSFDRRNGADRRNNVFEEKKN